MSRTGVVNLQMIVPAASPACPDRTTTLERLWTEPMSQSDVTARVSPVPGRPAPHPAVETAFLQPEAVLYDGRSGVVIVLNVSAAAVWMLLDGTRDVDALTQELSGSFEIPADIIRPDIETALAGFADLGVLVEGASPG
jgi:hypothetical protein